MKELSNLAKKIRIVRERVGMSRPKFAALIGVPPDSLKNYELGLRESIPADLLLAIINHPDLVWFTAFLTDTSINADDTELSK